MDRSMMKGIAVGGLAMVVLGASGVTGYRVLTQPEAEQLQFLMESLMDGQEVEAPQEMELALQKLALHGLVDEETATRH